MQGGDPFARARRHAHKDNASSLEIDRIVSLPIVELPTPEDVEAFCREEVQARYFEEGFRLFNTQVGAVLAWDLYKGGFFPIGVGWGKTLITLMIANRAFEERDSERSILCVPSQVYSQLTQRDIPWARKRVGLSVPFILMSGRDASSRRSAAASKKRGCYVIPYSLLSTKDTTDVLNGIEPDLMIFDEAHAIKSRKSARTARVLDYMRARQPRVVALSGTITSKSIGDYHHLITHALGERSPLPIEQSLAINWSYVLDATADPSDAQVGPITPLLEWSRHNFPAEKLPKGVPGFRKAYRIRLNTAPGVVATGDNQIAVSLTVQNKPVIHPEKTDNFAALEKLMKDVEELWRTPSGDEIEWGFQKWRYLYELTAGFYYKQRWPVVAEIVAKQHLDAGKAAEYIELAQFHHEARQEFSKKLRWWLEHMRRPHLDTPLLVESNMARVGPQDVGPDLFEAWRSAKEREFPGMPKRISEPVRVCDYKIRHAAAWARDLQEKDEGGLIWFQHDETGRWLAEHLEQEGIEAIWAPADSVKKGTNDLVDYKPGERRILVISMGGHGTGKNLQHEFYNQMFLDFPRQAEKFEQVLGRTHRNGQKADELIAHTMNTLQFDHLNMAACLVDALYVHQTTGSRHKAVYCSYDPLPKMYPSDFLRERGFVDVAQLDRATMDLLIEKYGPLEKA